MELNEMESLPLGKFLGEAKKPMLAELNVVPAKTVPLKSMGDLLE